MGLDQYAMRRKGPIAEAVDFKTNDTDELITQWRKHPNLEGWMSALYFEKGGAGLDSDPDCFNCCQLQLTTEDLDRLEEDVRSGALPETGGFFFGSDADSDEERDYDLDFIKKARAAIAEGDAVYYTSWW